MSVVTFCRFVVDLLVVKQAALAADLMRRLKFRFSGEAALAADWECRWQEDGLGVQEFETFFLGR